MHFERNRYWLIKYFEQEGFQEFKGTIVKVDGPKPVAELELTMTTHPFLAVNKDFKKRIGESVTLEIDQMDTQKEKFWLKEKPA